MEQTSRTLSTPDDTGGYTRRTLPIAKKRKQRKLSDSTCCAVTGITKKLKETGDPSLIINAHSVARHLALSQNMASHVGSAQLFFQYLGVNEGSVLDTDANLIPLLQCLEFYHDRYAWAFFPNSPRCSDSQWGVFELFDATLQEEPVRIMTAASWADEECYTIPQGAILKHSDFSSASFLVPTGWFVKASGGITRKEKKAMKFGSLDGRSFKLPVQCSRKFVWAHYLLCCVHAGRPARLPTTRDASLEVVGNFLKRLPSLVQQDVCCHYLKGKCGYGDHCWFAHRELSEDETCQRGHRHSQT